MRASQPSASDVNGIATSTMLIGGDALEIRVAQAERFEERTGALGLVLHGDRQRRPPLAVAQDVGPLHRGPLQRADGVGRAPRMERALVRRRLDGDAAEGASAAVAGAARGAARFGGVRRAAVDAERGAAVFARLAMTQGRCDDSADARSTDLNHGQETSWRPRPRPSSSATESTPALAVGDIARRRRLLCREVGLHAGVHVGRSADLRGRQSRQVQMFLQKRTPDPEGVLGHTSTSATPTCSISSTAPTASTSRRPSAIERAGLRDCAVRDLNGYLLSFGHHLFNVGPQIEIERVDVPVRLGDAAGRAARGSGEAQAHEREQLSRGDAAAHQRGRRPGIPRR